MTKTDREIIAEFTDRHTYVTETVETTFIYGVFYDDRLISVKSGHLYRDGVRNRSTTFANKKRAERLAMILNERYKTDRFRAEELVEKPTKTP